MKRIDKACVFLLALCCFVQGCNPRYVVLKQSQFPNPPQQKLRLRIASLEDPTGLYPKLKIRFEDEVARLLSGDDVQVISNIDRIEWPGGDERPIYGKVPNIFVPSLDSIISTGTAAIGTDLLLTGSVQEIYFGDAGFDAASYHFFGLAGVHSSKSAKVSLKIKVTAVAGNRPIFDRRIEAEKQGNDLDRTTDLDVVMSEAAEKLVSYLLEKR